MTTGKIVPGHLISQVSVLTLPHKQSAPHKEELCKSVVCQMLNVIPNLRSMRQTLEDMNVLSSDLN